MKFVEKKHSVERNNSKICVVTEYPTDHAHLDFAIVSISGKYPEIGYATNLISSEIIYVQSGSGQVTVNGVTKRVCAGDVILIEPNEQFIWAGDLQLHIACHPAFSAGQHVVCQNV